MLRITLPVLPLPQTGVNVVITEAFLNSEIEDIERESEKARVFLIQADATVRAYKVLIGKIQTPEVVPQEQ